MTTMGHSLTGLSIGVLCLPDGKRWWWIVICLHCFIALANIPDWPFTFWGHNHYDVSHSLLVTLVLAAAMMIGVGAFRKIREISGGWRVIVCGGLTWVSHLLLDTLYNHGQGLAMFWPLTEARLALPLPWFSTLRETWIPDAHTGRVLAIEAAVYGCLLVLCVVARFLWSRRSRFSRGTR
ncbi:MAG: metal-dependent hydrolase [Deltaproteobacteria bacterium]|nr:metal-dependent hydrolase [Deltaproteobacteria bacterium]